jgi:hypothetical protein
VGLGVGVGLGALVTVGATWMLDTVACDAQAARQATISVATAALITAMRADRR